MPSYGLIGIKAPRLKINAHNDKSEMQEDRPSLNAVEYVARAATSTAMLTSVDVPRRAGLEESHESFRTRNTDAEKEKRSEQCAARRLASPANDDTPTPDSVAQEKAPVPGEVGWTGPPRESSFGHV